MACHPSGITVDIVGLEASNNGRSCENHEVCGCVVAPDVVVRFKVVQLARPFPLDPPVTCGSMHADLCHLIVKSDTQ